MRRYGITGTVFLALLALGVTWVQGQPVALSADAKTVAKDNNVFALDLYSQLSKKDGNLFFSPYSISTALAMTYAGAKGKTAEEMARTLHFSLPQDKLHPAFGQLTKQLRSREDQIVPPGAKKPLLYQLSVANALWGQKGFSFLPNFLQATRTNYQANLEEVDFVKNTEQARQKINSWVEGATQKRIKDLIAKGILDEMTRLVLTNAIYFKAEWDNKFLPQLTTPTDFTKSDGQKVKVPMMKKTEKIPYFDAGEFHLTSIPYKRNALSMIIVLPKKHAEMAKVEKALTSANLDQWLTKATTHEVDLWLPKFKVTSEFSLKKALSEMGMPTAFTTKADFSGMSTQEKLFISEVIHKAYVDVHEKGTEAAAATAVIMTFGGIPPAAQKAVFHADHPFLFLVRENSTGSILFMGRVNDPTK